MHLDCALVIAHEISGRMQSYAFEILKHTKARTRDAGRVHVRSRRTLYRHSPGTLKENTVTLDYKVFDGPLMRYELAR